VQSSGTFVMQLVANKFQSSGKCQAFAKKMVSFILKLISEDIILPDINENASISRVKLPKVLNTKEPFQSM
jgi:hypothetical protein